MRVHAHVIICRKYILMENLDLDINNYNINDLERFFHIKPGKQYTAADIEEKEVELRHILLSSGDVDKKFKRDLYEFLETARDWLIHVKCKTATEKRDERLDKTTYHADDIPRTQEITKPSTTQYVHTQSDSFFRGTLNPLNTRIITKSVNIDTRFRKDLLGTQSSDFMVQLPERINKVVSMTLSSVEIPVTFYGISESYGNNYFHLSIIVTDGNNVEEKTKMVTVSDGNYTAADLINELNNAISPRDLSGAPVDDTDDFGFVSFVHDVTANGSGTGKFIITRDESLTGYEKIQNIGLDFGKTVQGERDITPLIQKLAYNLGYLKMEYTGSTAHIADTIADPSPIRYIYLAIDDYNNSANSHFISVFPDSILSKNIFARISVKGGGFSLLMENDFKVVSEPRRYFGPVDLHRMHIRLLDEHGRVLNMNNSNYSFCVNLKTVYDL